MDMGGGPEVEVILQRSFLGEISSVWPVQKQVPCPSPPGCLGGGGGGRL